MKILIVYQEIPEFTKLYACEVTEEEWAWMQLAQGNFVNSTLLTDPAAQKSCLKLNEWLQSQTPIWAETDIGAAYSKPIALRDQNFDFMLVTGFLL